MKQERKPNVYTMPSPTSNESLISLLSFAAIVAVVITAVLGILHYSGTMPLAEASQPQPATTLSVDGQPCTVISFKNDTVWLEKYPKGSKQYFYIVQK